MLGTKARLFLAGPIILKKQSQSRRMNGFDNLKNIIHRYKDIKMKVQFKFQKLNMQLAINWLSIIEICDLNISIGYETAFYKEKKDAAVKAYADVMTNIVKDAIELSNINLENIAA